MITFEFPLNERVRNYLRLEHLFDRLTQLIARDTALDHHFALQTLFELAETGSRLGNDLRSDLHKDLERHIQTLNGYRQHPEIDLAQLDQLLQEALGTIDALVHTTGKMGQSLSQNDWLHNIRNRIHIPGGTCSFDLPSYYVWQHNSAEERRAELVKWTQPYTPWLDCIRLTLRLLRLACISTEVHTKGPMRQYQQALDAEKSYQLASIGIADDLAFYPVISGTRHLLSVRFHPRGKTLPVVRESARDEMPIPSLAATTPETLLPLTPPFPAGTHSLEADDEVQDIRFTLTLSA